MKARQLAAGLAGVALAWAMPAQASDFTPMARLMSGAYYLLASCTVLPFAIMIYRRPRAHWAIWVASLLLAVFYLPYTFEDDHGFTVMPVLVGLLFGMPLSELPMLTPVWLVAGTCIAYALASIWRSRAGWGPGNAG